MCPAAPVKGGAQLPGDFTWTTAQRQPPSRRRRRTSSGRRSKKIEKLEEEKKEVGGQIKDVYQEAKSMGYDTKALRTVIRLRKLDRQEREEQEAILDTYLLALGEI